MKTEELLKNYNHINDYEYIITVSKKIAFSSKKK